MRKHTTLNLDIDLLEAAQRELGTTEKTETIHRALEEAINLRRRQRLAQRPLPGLTPETLAKIRGTGQPTRWVAPPGSLQVERW